MTVQHWRAPDALGDVLDEAWRPDAAAPTAVHVRPEVLIRVLAGMTVHARAALLEHGSIGHPPVLLVTDGTLPDHPGYEVHRTPPAKRGR